MTKMGMIIRALLLAGGAAMLVSGLLFGEARELLAKAVIVCMECIGIG